MELDVDPEKDFHVVLGGVATALSLDALDAAYQSDSIGDATLIWQEGMDEWMRLDALLVALGAQDEEEEVVEELEVLSEAPPPPVEDDTYFVMVAPEEIKKMSLDLLNDAYRLDVIDDDTLVWQPGFTEWIPLAVLLAGGQSQQHVSISPSLAPSQVPLAGAPAPLASAPAPGSMIPSAPLSAAPINAAPLSQPASMAPPASLAPTAASIAPLSQGAGFLSANGVGDLDLQMPVAAPAASPWFKRSLIALSAVAVLFILQRQGVMGDSDSLLQMEANLGAPGNGTVQELDRWLDDVSVENGLKDLSKTKPLPSDTAQGGDTEDPNSAPSEDELMEKARKADEAAAKKAKTEGGSQASSFGARLAGKNAAKKSAPAKKRKWRPKAKKASSSSSSGNKYDPMNGAL